MGILNVTPDSFSDGGRFVDPEIAVAHALEMIEAGADYIDIGGESTRPGAEPVSVDDEVARVVPIIERLADEIPSHVAISIDTQKAAVARAAHQAGATMVNDVSGLLADPEMLDVVASTASDVVVMHMVGTPQTMQTIYAYDDVVEEVIQELLRRTKRAVNAGIHHERIVVDPGIGFGKSTDHNLTLLRQISRFHDLGFRVLVGASRKRFLGDVTGRERDEREFATAAISAWCALQQIDIVRVHDVAATRDVVWVIDALQHGTNHD